MAAVLCRLESLRALAETAPESTVRLRQRLDRLATTLARADASPAHRRRELRRAKRLLRAVTAAIRAVERHVGEPLASALGREAEAARAALRGLG